MKVRVGWRRMILLIVNIVYKWLNHPDGFALQTPEEDTIIWSSLPIRDADLYAFFSAASYLEGDFSKDKPKVLITSEPLVVQPGEYSPEVQKHFDHVLLPIQFDKERDYSPLVPSEWYPTPIYNITPAQSGITPHHVLKADDYGFVSSEHKYTICMILGNKNAAPIVDNGELYSIRRPVAEWFEQQEGVGIAVFGNPPFEGLKCYQGILPPAWKRRMLQRHAFCICFDNCHHRIWSKSFLSARLVEVLECRRIPVYFGCYDIERWIPPELFVDARRFGFSADMGKDEVAIACNRLHEHLFSYTDEEYLAHIERIDAWLLSDARNIFDAQILYEKLVRVIDPTLSVSSTFPVRMVRQQYQEQMVPLWSWDSLSGRT